MDVVTSFGNFLNLMCVLLIFLENEELVDLILSLAISL